MATQLKRNTPVSAGVKVESMLPIDLWFIVKVIGRIQRSMASNHNYPHAKGKSEAFYRILLRFFPARLISIRIVFVSN